jgi:hypothetical protein
MRQVSPRASGTNRWAYATLLAALAEPCPCIVAAEAV